MVAVLKEKKEKNSIISVIYIHTLTRSNWNNDYYVSEAVVHEFASFFVFERNWNERYLPHFSSCSTTANSKLHRWKALSLRFYVMVVIQKEVTFTQQVDNLLFIYICKDIYTVCTT